MSSFTSTELTISREELDTSKITINANSNKLIIENNSPDVTISKCDPPTSVTMKTQVLPLVYIQNHSKTSFSSVHKPNNNVIVNNFQLATVDHNGGKNTSNVSAATNQNVIFTAGRQTPLVIHKPQGNMVPLVPVTVSGGTKIAGVFTMLKPTNKLTEPTIQLNNNMHHISQLNTFNQQQKFLFTPMPKLTTNRLATTTTSTVQPKLAILPMPVPISEPVVKQPKVYNNFKISDGQIQVETLNSAAMCNNENSVDSNSGEKLVCDEIIDLDSPDKNDLSNKTYELSITEDSVGSQNDVRTSVILNKLPMKEYPKFPKHGVSILKKNYNFLDRKVDKPVVTNNNAALISDNKEVSISGETDSVIITIPAAQKPEKERRRKSTLTCIKGYDEMEVTSTDAYGNEIFSKLEKQDIEITPEESKKNLTSEVEIELIKEKPALKVEDCDLQKVLNWDDGIGTLPGSEIKFILNEFNLIEYITDSEYKAIVEKRMAKAKEKMKTDFQEEMRCLECGCYGLSSDFINPKFCSYGCRDIYQSKLKKKGKTDRFKKKKKKTKIETDPGELKKEEESEDDSISNIFQDKYMPYPWSWSKYLEQVKAKPAPVKLFKDPFPYNRNGFRPGMKLEGVDPQHPSYFCVLSVAKVLAYRIRLHFDGYPDNYDFWCNADSMDIFPMGWCEKYGHVLQPPSGYTVDNFNWLQYLKLTKSTAAPKHLFANRAGQAICPNGFRIGMKLEAVDRKNTSLVCVASIRDMMDNRLLVHFDSWDDIYDYWADPTSPYIHPVGWCDQYGHNLTPPNDYPNPESFSWETYLKETKAVAAPVRAFKQRPACGFKRGMRLECVDKRVPEFIRVATVDDVKEHQIRIKFDGWPDEYSYWVDDDSPDIHPMGWCQKTAHPLEPPLTPEDAYDSMGCPTVGCRGDGHKAGPKFDMHSSDKNCPYAEWNLNIEKIVPDRLLSPDKSPAAVVPVSREPKECKIKPRLGRPPKHPRPEPKPVSEEEVEEEEVEEPPEKKKPLNEPLKLVKKELDVKSVEQSAREFIERANIVPAERKSWAKHSEFLQQYIKTDFDPRLWTNREVVNFVSKIPGCSKVGDVFRREDIDGEALLLLSQKDILTILKIKVGPALKLYNSILLLRQQVFKKLFS